ncbi:CHAP domain-containing protein [Streptosporangium sp. KLBMP 9127]|nr:CHAP domain-containing protein [Streptosporangium sp. KLBMP 9127]
MTSIADGLLRAAQKDLGYREQSNGYTKFGDWYYANVDQSDSYFKTAPWCDMFIAWAANEAGVEQYVGEFAYTVDHAKWFMEQGAWSDTPEPGALVFYDWAGSDSVEGIDHVGIVEKAEGQNISTIEANVDAIWLKRKERDQSNVVGYGLPRKVQENKDGSLAQESEGTAAAAFGGDTETPVKSAAMFDLSPADQKTVASVTAASPDARSSMTPAIHDGALPAALLTLLLCATLVAKGVNACKSVERHRAVPA